MAKAMQVRTGGVKQASNCLTIDRWPAAVHGDLVAYAEIFAQEHGQTVEPAKLVPLMLARFMSTDQYSECGARRAMAVEGAPSSSEGLDD
jgi:hypothetical protein